MSVILDTMENLRLAPGALFANRFAIEERAGSGGMGTVYRARDRYTGDLVALKLLNTNLGGSDEAERFSREAQILSELRHPGIVSYVTHGQTPDGQRFLAMEWLEGQDLGQRLRRGPLPLRDSLVLLTHVVDALSIAHQRGIIHRDLKPTNLFLVWGDVARVKILDFGIARRLARSQVMTRTGMVVGTPEYMAPEQARGGRDLLPAADFFSLGCVLYECLTGQPPFVADHIAAVLVRILFEEATPVEALRPGIPATLTALLARLLCKDPAQRLSDAAALQKELASVGDVPEPAIASTLASSKTAAPSFAEAEQSLFSVVLAAPPEEEDPLDPTLLPADVLPSAERQGMLAALQAMGVSADFLASGALVATVPSMDSATDQVTQAARAALYIKERWPAAVVSLATGRGVIRGRTAVGEVVEVAARALKSGSQPAPRQAATGVLMDPLSAKLLEGRFAQTPHPGGALLLGEERAADVSRQLLGKPTPCVGRETELATLEAQLTGSVEESEARAVLFTAPPGVGKSRLRHEFLRRVALRNQPILVLQGRGDILSAGTPYGILGQALRKRAELGGGEPHEAQRAQIERSFGSVVADSERKRVVEFISELCNVPWPDDGSGRLMAARADPRIMRDQVRRAFLEWLTAACQSEPVLLVLDDLQWGDALSVGLVDDALRELRSLPLLVLALARPEVREVFPKLWPGQKLQELALKGLSRKACERLAQQVLGQGATATVIGRVVEQSAGNALFLEELIRAAAEGKSEEEPQTVVAMLQTRIARFNPGPRKAVRAASVFGQTFWRGGVAALLERQEELATIDDWLGMLVDAEVIEPRSQSQLADEKEYGFRHALVRDAVYSLLTAGDIATGHRLAGIFLEERGHRDAAVIARHHELGGELLRAAAFYCRAAENAVDNFSLENALRWAERGIACGPSAELLGTLRSIEASACFYMGMIQRAWIAALSALPLLRAGSAACGRTLHVQLTAAIFGPPELRQRLPEIAAQLMHNVLEPGAESLYAEGLAWLACGTAISIPGPQREVFVAHLQSLCQRAALRNPTVNRFLLWGRSHPNHHLSPTPWQILRDGEEAMRLSHQAGDVRFLAITATCEGAGTWEELGDPDKTIAMLQPYLERLKQTQEINALITVKMWLARLLSERHDAAAQEQAITYARETLAIMGSANMYSTLAHEVLARVLLHQGRLEEAEVMARQACRDGEALAAFEPNRHATLIRILLAQGRHREAVEIAEAVVSLLQCFGGLGNVEVELRLTISETFAAAGNRERAQTELRETLRQVQIRADDILDPFWKNSYLTRNAYCARALQLGTEWGLDVVIK